MMEKKRSAHGYRFESGMDEHTDVSALCRI
jgi:hypothetical protein